MMLTATIGRQLQRGAGGIVAIRALSHAAAAAAGGGGGAANGTAGGAGDMTRAFPGNEMWQPGAGFVGGKWVPAASGEEYVVTDPATKQVIERVANFGPQDVARAIDVAHDAFGTWKNTIPKDRSRMLHDLGRVMVEKADQLALILTRECGKPLAEAKGEIVYGASFLTWFAGEAVRIYGEVIPAPQGDRRILVLKQPVGVAALITPWNFPNAMITRKLGAALAAGCTTVIKPAEDTPLSAFAIAHLAQKVGIPDGVVNVVPCHKSHVTAVGKELCTNHKVRKVSFTGSVNVGKLLVRDCSSTLKRVSMELGGNAPLIVFEDADLDLAVQGAMASKFRNAGQTCVCANRIFVHAAVYDEFARKFTAAVQSQKIGVGTEAGVTIGPLINSAAVRKSQEHVEDAVKKGAKVLTGGAVASGPGLHGHFYQPTVLSNVDPSMLVFTQETFGPVAPLFKFHSDAEVVGLANDVSVGLAGYFFTRNLSRAWRVAEALQVGMVGINTGVISTEVAPFGGVKESGLGREGAHQGVDEYVDLKYVCMAGL